MKRITGGGLAALVLLAASVAWATVRPAPGEELASAQAQIADLTADFELTVAGAGEDGGNLTAAGRVWLGSNRRYRVEYQRPEEQVLVSNGTQRWLYLKAIQQVQIQPLPPAGDAGEFFLELGGGLPDVIRRCNVSRTDGPKADTDRYALVPAGDSGLGFERALVITHGPNRVPQRVEITAGRNMTVVFHHVRLHTRAQVEADPSVGTPPERFAFSPPEGAEVVELLWPVK